MEVTYRETTRESIFVALPPPLPAEPRRVAVVTGLRPGEPIFVLRAQDALALATINLWREMAYGLLDDARAEAVEADLHAFIEWRHGPGREFVKDPD